MRLGAGTDNDAVVIASEGQIISQASWEELAERDQHTAWEIYLVTPTTFSSKGNHVPSLSPATIATSLQQRKLRPHIDNQRKIDERTHKMKHTPITQQ